MDAQRIAELLEKEKQLDEMMAAIKRLQEDKSKSVKKTLTIPGWLNAMAEENKVNFSQTLQDALKVKLGISHLL